MVVQGIVTTVYTLVAGIILELDFNLYIPLITSDVIFLVLIFAIFGREWKAEKVWDLPKIKATPLTLCIIFGIAFNILTVCFFIFVPVPQESFLDDLVGNNLILELISIALFAAVIEEILFRGIVLKRLSKMMKPTFAVILSAVIFGIIHFDLVQSSYAFVVGLVLGLVYVWFDSIWLVIAIHFTYNGINVVLNHLLGETEINLVVLIIITGVSLVVSVGCLLGLYSNRKLDIINGGEE